MIQARFHRIVLISCLAIAVGLSLLSSTAFPAQAAGSIAGCQIFPSNNPWNTDIRTWPLHPNSTNIVNNVGANQNLHPDFGSELQWGIPITIRDVSDPFVPITYDEENGWPEQSDPGPFPIPLDARIEGSGPGGDNHVLVVDPSTCMLYELYHARQIGNGWTADSGAKYNLNSNAVRPAGWTSADAAGLPIMPGLVRFDEAMAGSITHAIRFTVNLSRRAYVFPARHYASDSTDPNRPRMGERFRLKASWYNANINNFTGPSRAILEAMRTYGMIVADNGSDWFFQGESVVWDDEVLDPLKSVPGSAFEVVQAPTTPATPVGTATPLPATRTVTKLADTNDGVCDADCSLREAVAVAWNNDTISFQSGLTGTITLGSPIGVSRKITINGPGARLLTISGNNLTRQFTLNAVANLTLMRVSLADGKGGASNGAITNSGTLSLSYVMFINNKPSALYTTGTLSLNRSTVSGNGQTGGAVIYAGSGTVTISNSTITGNIGNVVSNNGATVTLINSTVAGNTGNGVNHLSGSTTVKNTIIANNSSNNCVGTIVNGGSNLQFPASTCGATITTGDPMLGALAANGGPTNTMKLLSGSAAIDTGSNTVCAATPISNADQRVSTRPIDGNGDSTATCDIGAYEAPLAPGPAPAMSDSAATATPVPTFVPLP
jgi:CSLREA domain-containing protein